MQNKKYNHKQSLRSYDHRKVEKKWQQMWEEKGVNHPGKMEGAKKPFYNLWMFPYPSAAGLHAGHAFASTGSDVYGRFQRMRGYEVFQPIGYDSFGIHGENFAIKRGKHPMDLIKKTTKNYERQLRSLGHGYDWTRTVTTSDIDYYSWTQWLFVQLFKAGLAYRKEAEVNWCPSCKTVLADEQVMTPSQAEKEPKNAKGEKVNDTGDLQVCERCGTIVERRKLAQWFFRITDYADKLLEGLDKIDWPERIKIAQRNWIGKKVGINITYSIKGTQNKLTCWTSRPDTNFGATFIVVSPEYAQENLMRLIEVKTKGKIKKYIEKSLSKSKENRIEEGRKKTGAFTGLYAINNLNGYEMPIWVADFVLSDVGTGAVVGVPGHDKRDFEFAKEFNLEIVPVVSLGKYIGYVKKEWSTDFKHFIKGLEKLNAQFLERNEKQVLFVIETKYLSKWLELAKKSVKVGSWHDLVGDDFVMVTSDGKVRKTPKFKDPDDLFKIQKKLEPNVRTYKDLWDMLYGSKYTNFVCNEEEGQMINSEFINGLDIHEATVKMMNHLEKKGWGERVVNYHLRDWLISRQRYWGPPIPMIHCIRCAKDGRGWLSKNKKLKDWESAGWWPVPEKDLPVELPYLKDFKPKGGGRGPLADSKKFLSVKCPECGNQAEREPDVSDTFLDSAWYFIAYPQVGSDKYGKGPSKVSGQDAFDKKVIKSWLPVDLYFGGAEHAVLHLMYSRFITKVLQDLDFLDFDEPFPKFFAHGLMIKDGAKMSKSRGNVVNPDEYIEKYGADTLRLYTMFMGPMDGYPDFRDTGIEGMSRFLGRVWELFVELNCKTVVVGDKDASSLLTKLHQTIRKCTDDIKEYKYNTAIAAIMEFVNELRGVVEKSQKQVRVSQNTKSIRDDKAGLKSLPALSKDVWKESLETLCLLLAPFAPHFAEEVWCEVLGNDFSVHKAKWPKFDNKLAKEENVTISVQVNGKLRSTLQVTADKAKDEKYVINIAKKDQSIKKWIKGKSIEKEIFVPGRLVNIVVK